MQEPPEAPSRRHPARLHHVLDLLRRGRGRRRPRPAPGARPHTLAIPEDAPAPRIRWFSFTPDRLDEREVTDLSILGAAASRETVDWVHVQGFGDESQLRAIGEVFGIHPLALADIVNVPQRAKFDDYGNHQLLILRVAQQVESGIEIQQLSLVRARDWVITFEDGTVDVLDPVRRRLQSPSSRIRRSDASFLAYSLVDAAVDAQFPMMDRLIETLDTLEEESIANPAPETLARIHAVRRQLVRVERSQRQQRDALLALSHHENAWLDESLRPYLRDVVDHAIHGLDTLETLREMTLGIMDIYLSSVANRTNEVMKTLTVMATVFIPLTFLAGLYGMNFDHMPELRWRWGYGAVLAVMAVTSLGLLVWFRRRGWLGTAHHREGERVRTGTTSPER